MLNERQKLQARLLASETVFTSVLAKLVAKAEDGPAIIAEIAARFERPEGSDAPSLHLDYAKALLAQIAKR